MYLLVTIWFGNMAEQLVSAIISANRVRNALNEAIRAVKLNKCRVFFRSCCGFAEMI